MLATAGATAIGSAATSLSKKVTQTASRAAPSVQATATKASSAAQKATKVVSEIKNETIDLQRVGSALKLDQYHAFPDIVDNYAGLAMKKSINNGTLYQLQGALNGVSGRYEWIVQGGQVTHRMFVKGGGMNGIPIMP